MSVEVKGLRELAAALRALPRELGAKGGGPLRAAIFQSAKLIRDEARRLAPEDTGNLKRNVIAARMRKVRQGTEGYFVEGRRKKRGKRKASAKLNDAYYAMMIELGTEKMKSQPFIRPAFESTKHAAVEAFRKAFAAAIARAAAKVKPR